MTKKEFLRTLDHTQLKAFATMEDMDHLCQEAIELQTASVCIPPEYVAPVNEKYGNQLTICTVIGFPLGYQETVVKEEEAKKAIEDGADELDLVISIAKVKNKAFDLVEEEIKKIRQISKDNILKVIIETCYLEEEEKIKLCQIITRAKADYIKTSTGFGSAGAKLSDILLFKQHIGPEVKIKAAGGIRSLEEAKAFLEAGCSRIGTSNGMKMAEEWNLSNV